MKKLLAILGSIGLTSTTASAVIACGNGGNANIGGNKNIVVNPDITNGSYDAASKTFTAQYGSDQYQAHKISFSLTKVVLKVENIQVVNAQGTNIDQESGLWKFWISENGANTVFEIEDSSLNGATIQINLDNHLSTSFKIAIHQDQNLVVNNVINGTYEKATTTLTANYQSSQYSENKMRFSLANVSLSESNFNVIKSDGTKAEAKDGLWSYVVSDNTTTVHIDDYHLNQATIQINLDGYNSITFKIVINQSKEIAIDNNTVNGNYNSASKTFTATYSSAQYDNHKMSFTINDLTLDASNVVVKAVGEQVTTGWSLSTTTNTTTITLDDYHLNGVTITIQGVDGYWPVTFSIIITQDKHFVIADVTNGEYVESTKTFTAKYGNSIYHEEGHQMSFKIKGLALQGKDFVLVKDNSGQEITTGWESVVSGSDTIITISDYNLNNAKVIVQNVDGYWPETFNVAIPQDQVFSPNVTNGSYDTSTNTLTAKYGNSTYQEGHEMSFTLSDISLSADNIVVKDSKGATITSGWNFTTSDENTTITIDDYNLNGATIQIQDVDGYWPIVFNVVIPQDQNVVVNSDVSHGKYDDLTKTLIADYESNQYDSDSNHNMYFSLYNLVLNKNNIIVKDVGGDIVDMTTDRWSFWTSFDNNRKVENTVFQIKDSKLNGATIEIKDVGGYWPIKLKIVINQSQE